MKKYMLNATALTALTMYTFSVHGAACVDDSLEGSKPASSLKNLAIHNLLKNGQIPNSYLASQETLANLLSEKLNIADISDILPDIARGHYLYLRKQPRPFEDLIKNTPPGTVALNAMPAWLKPHFSGISVQDLVDYSTEVNRLEANGEGEKLDPSFRYSFRNLLRNSRVSLDNENINDLAGIQHLTNAEWINLNDNLISNIAPGSFAGFTIINLDLRNNAIKTILPKTFADLDYIGTIYLGGNPIDTFAPDAFDRNNGSAEGLIIRWE